MEKIALQSNVRISDRFLGESNEKSLLAFDALSKLTKQFASNPDFQNLIEVMLLTLSGQFSVPSSFVSIWSPESDLPRMIYIASGKLRNNERIANLIKSPALREIFSRREGPLLVTDLQKIEGFEKVHEILHTSRVLVIAPFLHKDVLIGLLGFGEKANRKKFGERELELLDTFIRTTTPLITNSLLFMEISSLNKWFLEILDNVQQGIFVLDSAGKIVKINDAGFAVLKTFLPGVSNIESLRCLPLTSVFPNDIFPRWVQRLTDTNLATSKGFIEKLIAVKPGIERVYNARVSMTRTSSLTGKELIITLDDITAQIDNEQRLFNLEKLAEKGLMASSISHELNNFLALLLGGVELTEIAINTGAVEKVTAIIDKIKGHLDRMQRFTAGLMNYAAMEPRKSAVNLNSLVNEVLSFVTVQRKFKAINIEANCDSALPAFEMDADQISQLILNLLNNAADALCEAGRTIGQIRVGTQLSDDHAILSISDNGVGIDPEIKARLFKSRLTTKEKGHGFGLITCAKIIEHHAATVEIDSELGKGTTFTIRFPIIVCQS